jgi:BirA family biotin operon repressor/biotin-[acetyl-CoA-carboxylase] ligase
VTFGTPHRHYARTDSTNTRARELAAAGALHGTVVTAAEQTAGRGRQGRSWTAPPGQALLYSAVLRPLTPRHVLLPLAVPLAVCEAAEELRPEVECKVKWPNDVHLEGRKLAGILIEARPQDGWAVLGIGLNLEIAPEDFPPELRETAISLMPPAKSDRDPCTLSPSGRQSAHRARTGGGSAAQRTLAALNGRLERWLEAGEDEVLAAWRERDALRGRQVSWEGGSGVADGVDERGFLLVRVADGDRVALGAGEVHLTSF